MSLNYINFEVSVELDSPASYIFTDEEELMWYKMYFLAARTSKREGYLELMESRPYTVRELAYKVYREGKHDITKLTLLIQTMLEKAVANDLMGIAKNGAYYFKNWGQLTKDQRSRKHRTMQAGQFFENGQVKPVRIDTPEKDEIIAGIYAAKNPDKARQVLAVAGDEIITKSGDHYRPGMGKVKAK